MKNFTALKFKVWQFMAGTLGIFLDFSDFKYIVEQTSTQL